MLLRISLGVLLCSIWLSLNAASAAALTANSAVQLGYAEMARGHYQSAIATLSTELATDPKNTTARRYLVYALLRSGRTVEAVVNCKDLVVALPNSASDFALLGDCLKSDGDHHSALGSYSHALQLDPRCFKAYIGMARSYLECRHWQNVKTICHNALKKQPPASEYNEFREILQSATNLELTPAETTSNQQHSSLSSRTSSSAQFR
jgi:tetratricopeptide (TPR) repeat protein